MATFLFLLINNTRKLFVPVINNIAKNQLQTENVTPFSILTTIQKGSNKRIENQLKIEERERSKTPLMILFLGMGWIRSVFTSVTGGFCKK